MLCHLAVCSVKARRGLPFIEAWTVPGTHKGLGEHFLHFNSPVLWDQSSSQEGGRLDSPASDPSRAYTLTELGVSPL